MDKNREATSRRIKPDLIRKWLEVREVEIVEGTHTRTHTRTRESPKTRVEIVGKRDLSVRVRVRVRKKQPKELGRSVIKGLFEQAQAADKKIKMSVNQFIL